MFHKGKKTLRDQVEDLADNLADKIAPHVENARDQIAPLIADAREKAGPALADARDKAAPYVSDARDKAAPFVSDARDKAAPYLSDARDKAAPYVSDARDRFVNDVVPAVTAAVAAAGEKAAPVRDEARRRGVAAAAALKGEVDPPKKGSKLKKLLLVGGLAGLGAFLYKKFKGEDQSSSWQSSYTPPAPATPSRPTPAPAPVGDPLTDASFGSSAAGTDDATGATPGEAVSDASAESGPHAVTTPDQPADEVDLSDKPDPQA